LIAPPARPRQRIVDDLQHEASATDLCFGEPLTAAGRV
jgi:hypothetical protein